MAEQKSAQERAAAAASKDNPEAGVQKVDAQPLSDVQPAGVRQAGGPASHKEFVASDKYAHDAIPGANGPEAVGSGSPLPVDAAKAADDRRRAGIPEPPKVGPANNVDLYDTPGGYQAVPAGFDPYGLQQANAEVVAALREGPDPSKLGAEVKLVAGPGSKAVKDA